MLVRHFPSGILPQVLPNPVAVTISIFPGFTVGVSGVNIVKHPNSRRNGLTAQMIT